MKNRLAKVRSKCSLTQSQLAFKVGCSKNTISSIERGEFNPTLVLAFKIADVFYPEGYFLEDIFLHDYPDHQQSFL